MEALELIVRRLREAPQHANMVLVAQADGPCYHASSLVAMDTAIWQRYGQDELPFTARGRRGGFPRWASKGRRSRPLVRQYFYSFVIPTSGRELPVRGVDTSTWLSNVGHSMALYGSCFMKRSWSSMSTECAHFRCHVGSFGCHFLPIFVWFWSRWRGIKLSTSQYSGNHQGFFRLQTPFPSELTRSNPGSFVSN
jgi:hypothetical protein